MPVKLISVSDAMPVNTCATCKHLLGTRNNLDTAAEKWRCHHPANISSNKTDVVTGLPIITYSQNSIYAVRSNGASACGEAGALWELYEHPSLVSYTPQPTYAERLAKLRKKPITLGDI